MNRIELIGRLTNEPELRATANGKEVCDFNLAIRRDENNTDFLPVTVWGTTASTLCKYCQKGDLIAVEGRLESHNYEKEDKKYTKYIVLGSRIEFLNLKNTKKEEKVEEQEEIFDINQELEDDDLPF